MYREQQVFAAQPNPWSNEKVFVLTSFEQAFAGKNVPTGAIVPYISNTQYHYYALSFVTGSLSCWLKPDLTLLQKSVTTAALYDKVMTRFSKISTNAHEMTTVVGILPRDFPVTMNTILLHYAG